MLSNIDILIILFNLKTITDTMLIKRVISRYLIFLFDILFFIIKTIILSINSINIILLCENNIPNTNIISIVSSFFLYIPLDNICIIATNRKSANVFAY